MDSTDTLKIKIEEARALLPKENREAIDNVNWKLIILEIGKKYNQEQLSFLETETELLLCGILGPEEYQKELKKIMQISKEEVSSLLNEMDKLIFRKMKSELEKILEKGKGEVITDYQLPITNEDKIITDYRLPITNKETNTTTITNEKEVGEDEVPKPPYSASITNYELRINNEREKNAINDDKLRIKNETPVEIPLAQVEPKQEMPNSIFEEKLKKPTASEHTVSDYSSKTPDPYREAF